MPHTLLASHMPHTILHFSPYLRPKYFFLSIQFIYNRIKDENELTKCISSSSDRQWNNFSQTSRIGTIPAILQSEEKKEKVEMAASKLQALWNHPAGPKTIHFWAPTFKWGISIANVADFAKPPEKISYPQQIVVGFSGLIWTRYGMVITPVNWNLASVNFAMSCTGFYQLSRKIRQDYLSKEPEKTAVEG